MTMDQIPPLPMQRSVGATVTARLDLWSVVEPGFRMHVPACLRYDPKDPFAVSLDHYVDLHATVTWVFARDLLAMGLSTRAGTGDVSVRPGMDGAQTVFISLRGPTGEALLQAEEGDIRKFVQHSECLVPIGAEHDHFDLGAALHRLRETPPTNRGS
ncbi:SsgA family sporulation/cell division regulator [Streptacidiphilus sp. N8-3]|uniref:SsgA family sporulation/cell division regulator n=2 Tax=Streptacidiphilus cavernicola TaxID=3342716 RepID=A0ABV6VWI9_9ACTN